MLRIGWKRRDRRETAGHCRRIVAAALLSRLRVPLGDTGGADVPPPRPMPIPDDLAGIHGEVGSGHARGR